MKNYITGILGGLLGGIIATLPWVLMYVYGNFILSILAAVIATGFYFGYKLCKGPLNKKTAIIITISSIFIVIMTTLITIPLLSLLNEGYEASFENLQILYESSEYVTSVVKDLVISVIFTMLGVGGVVAKAKQEAENTPVKENTEKGSVIY